MDYDTQDSPSYDLAPEGVHEAVISKVDIYNNPSGPDKLQLTFTMLSEDKQNSINHMEFVIPSIMEGDGFRVFADLLKLIYEDELESEGEFNEKDLEGLDCLITIKHVEGKGKHDGKTFANLMKVEEPKDEDDGDEKEEPKKKTKKK